jgi:flavin-dependent dehydrogenase
MPTGNALGIHTAMMSGKLAAETAAEAISRGDASDDFLKKYDDALKDSFIWDGLHQYSRRDLIRHAGDEGAMKRHILEVAVMPGLTAVF